MASLSYIPTSPHSPPHPLMRRHATDVDSSFWLPMLRAAPVFLSFADSWGSSPFRSRSSQRCRTSNATRRSGPGSIPYLQAAAAKGILVQAHRCRDFDAFPGRFQPALAKMFFRSSPECWAHSFARHLPHPLPRRWREQGLRGRLRHRPGRVPDRGRRAVVLRLLPALVRAGRPGRLFVAHRVRGHSATEPNPPCCACDRWADVGHSDIVDLRHVATS